MWQDLLGKKEQNTIVLPWTGGRRLRFEERSWSLNGTLPAEFTWGRFEVSERRTARFVEITSAQPDALSAVEHGYLVGDRFVPDTLRVDPKPEKISAQTEAVFLIPDGLDRFDRVSVGRIASDCPYIFRQQEMPLGPEADVQNAYLDRLASVNEVKGVSPGLDAAFRMATWQRVSAEKRREELERKRIEEEARRLQEERRKDLDKQLATATARREMAKIDFETAARAALAVSGAEYLDHRKAYVRGEVIVRFRLINRRFECVCNERTLQITEAGLCLSDHRGHTDDGLLSLESLPSVIREANRTNRLVVLRHA